MIKSGEIIKNFERIVAGRYHTNLKNADVKTIYNALSDAVMENIYSLWQASGSIQAMEKQACYFSAEFLVGRAIYNNLLNLGILEEVRTLLAEKGIDIGCMEEIEDAALGNGGLGRLAACFLDSAATHRIPLTGYGIRYRYGLFRQFFEDGFQKEAPDDWTRQGDPWSVRREEEKVKVSFVGQEVWAVPYDMPIIGYESGQIGTLRLWQSEAVNEFDFGLFNEEKYHAAVGEKTEAETISMVLYPNDSKRAGKVLRLRQQYFFSSASLKDIVRAFKKNHGANFSQLPNYYVIQLNDTHPVVSIPELIRILMAEEGLPFDEAFGIARRMFAYTNHTVLSEALEKWSVALFKSTLPEIYDIVVKINQRLLKELTVLEVPGKDLPKYKILSGRMIHMAKLAVYSCFSVNGVAKIHTEILKESLFNHWVQLYPERFRNKTNGITQRRFLGLCNPELTEFIESLIGTGFLKDLNELKKLEAFAEDRRVIETFAFIKYGKKQQLARYIRQHEGISIDPGAIFDVQIKRLHEYKRQLLNAFSILHIYFKLKSKELEQFNPTVFIFGAKAAPGYARAKGIIKYIHEIAKLINNDIEVRDQLKVVFVSNYNVSYAEKIIPAADISEQISTAGTEASGTGNMKLMLNGAVTLGTYDGANIEIVEMAGEENNYIFGATVDEIAGISPQYDPNLIYQKNPDIKRVVDTLVDGTFDDGGTGIFAELYTALLKGASWHDPDHYFLLHDFSDYVEKKLRANADFGNRNRFYKKCFLNMANSGPFSSDRTVREYATDIWGLEII